MTAQRSNIVQHDDIFSDPKNQVDDFNFGKETARVFDDMLDRSVPFYREMQRIIGELAGEFATDGSQIWDLGCSTCNSFLAIESRLDPEADVRFVGIDSSEEMLERARRKLVDAGFGRDYTLTFADLNQSIAIENASVVLLLLTLQFVRPLNRERLLADIFKGMNKNGALILIEKVLGEDSTFNRLFIDKYYAFKKRKGYSELEIAQKREALENVLVPYRLKENEELLLHTGFASVEIFFKWYNFAGIIARK